MAFTRRRISELITAIRTAAYELRTHFAAFFTITMGLATVASWILASQTLLIACCEAALLIVYSIGRLAMEIIGGGGDLKELEIKEFRAIPYAKSSPEHLAQLSALAAKFFKEDTLPPGVVREAAGNGSMLGLRLINEAGQDIGFLDLICYRDDVMEKWRTGEGGESGMDIRDFQPIGSHDPSKPLQLAVGALLVQQPVFSADIHLTEAFIYAGAAYFKQQLARFPTVEIFATIFNKKGGKRWAKTFGFKPDTPKELRKGLGSLHDLYKLDLKDASAISHGVDGTEFVGIGDNYKFVVRLEA